MALVAGSPFATRYLQPASIAVTPNSKFAYVANDLSGSISGYAIDAATGALTPLAGSPFASGMGPNAVTVSPNGRFAYAANYVSQDVSAFNIDADTGAIEPASAAAALTMLLDALAVGRGRLRRSR